MSSLKHPDRIWLENILNMDSGYVSDFSDRTFRDFILENTGIDVYTDEYTREGTSKAKRLRNFWKKESNYLTAKLIRAFGEYWKMQKLSLREGLTTDEALIYFTFLEIAKKLEATLPIDDVEAFTPNYSDKTFSLIASSIHDSIAKGEPNQALDRLHTFVVKYIRALCDKHSISYEKDLPLHSLFGKYIKFLQDKNLIESEMSLRILKTSISLFEALNSVRNNQSFAHDNHILNHTESVLIFNNVSNILRFIESIESKQLIGNKIPDNKETMNWKDISFTEEELKQAGDSWIQNEIDQMEGK